jgi:hypothetical protein
MSTVVECTRSSHSMLILLADVALLCLCIFLASGFITGFSPISGSVHSLSLSLSLSEYEHFYFPSPVSGLYFFIPLSVRTSQCSISPISGLYSSLISTKPSVRVTPAARRIHFNNILESRGCPSHPYTRSLWVTL